MLLQKHFVILHLLVEFAEYILRKSYQSGGKLVGETISHFKIQGLEKIKGIIDKAGLKRNGNKISTLTELRNECEHNLYSDASYIFFADNPSVNVFMYNIACKIIMEMAGFATDL